MPKYEDLFYSLDTNMTLQCWLSTCTIIENIRVRHEVFCIHALQFVVAFEVAFDVADN